MFKKNLPVSNTELIGWEFLLSNLELLLFQLVLNVSVLLYKISFGQWQLENDNMIFSKANV